MQYFFTVDNLFAQFENNTPSIKGVVLDAESNEPLVGASIVLTELNKGVIANVNGSFRISNLVSENYKIAVSYIGYEQMNLNVKINNGEYNLGIIKLQPLSLGLNEVEVIADIVKERVTPVAATTISATYIEQNLGNQEFPEILRNTPSVYATKRVGDLVIRELM